MTDAEVLAADIRAIDGDLKTGTLALAEALVERGWRKAPVDIHAVHRAEGTIWDSACPTCQVDGKPFGL